MTSFNDRSVLTALESMARRTSALGNRRPVTVGSFSAMTAPMRSAASSRATMPYCGPYPSRSAWRRRMRLPMRWNVPAQSRSPTTGTSWVRRSVISFAARLVNVSSMSRSGSTPWESRCAAR
jgi:hypothetical protein